MNEKKSAVLRAVSAALVDSFIGAMLAMVIGLSPVLGVVIGLCAGAAMSCMNVKGVLRAGVFTEIWTGEMIKAFRTAKESLGWYDRIKSYDQYVNNDVIHFTELGGDPEVLVNNTTYPLDIESLEDADKAISLDHFDTTATPVTDDELYAVSYDKMASVQERHREALREAVCQKAIHAIAPSANSDTTPVLTTTGEATSDGTRKKFTVDDLLAAKAKCDKMGMPKSDRILVMCSDHINDLLETEQSFKEHYNINQTEGKIARLYGFDIYEYDGTPYYTVSTLEKLAWGSEASDDTDRQCSVFYYNGRIMKANGSVQFYHSEANQDPLYHRNLVNFRKWGICLPLKEDYSIGAIVSALSDSE